MNKIKKFLIIGSLFLVPLFSVGQEDPSIPVPPDCPTGGDSKAGAGASIADGAFILIAFALSYGVYKYQLEHKKIKEHETSAN